MSVLINKMNTLACSICYNLLDEYKNIPLLFKNCGHSFCKNCISEIIKPFTGKKKAMVNCPNCRSKQSFNGLSTHLEEEFPRNYLYLATFAEKSHQKTESETLPSSTPAQFLCVDPNCMSTDTAPFNLDNPDHIACDPKYQINVLQIEQLLDFKVPNFELDFDVISLKTNIKRQLKNLRNMMLSMTEACHEQLREEVKYIEKAKMEVEYFLRNKKIFQIEKTINSDKISVSLKNYDSLKKFARQNSLELNSVFNEKIKEISQINLQSIISRNLYEFKEFNSNVFVKNRDTFERLRGIQSKIFHDFFLSDWTSELNFSFQGAIESVKTQVSAWRPKFDEIEMVNLQTQDKVKIMGICQDAFRQPQIGFKSVEEFIKKRLNENEKRGNWSVVFSHKTFPNLENPKVCSAVFMCANFYIGVWLKKDRKIIFKFA